MNKEEQKYIFNIFHDGSFQNFRPVGDDIEFDVAIEYLAQVVNPQYTLFKVIMKNCQQLMLDIWDVEETEDIATINDFADDLEILSADIDPKGNVYVIDGGVAQDRGALGVDLGFKRETPAQRRRGAWGRLEAWSRLISSE